MSTFCNYWNKVNLVKSKIKKSKKIDSIGIGLASPEEIRRWGERRLPNGTLVGKVDKDHTVDYESLKPIEGGLFCERIFGPVEDFYCSCERKGEKNEKFCPTCQVEFTKSRVRRIRMGYIPLAVPVAHVWYLRGRPSYIANLVGKSRNSIDRLAYGETLSESFIGYSSLESIYQKEKISPKSLKRLHDAVKSNYDAKDLLTEDTNQRKLLQNELQKNSDRNSSATLDPYGVQQKAPAGSGIVSTSYFSWNSIKNDAVIGAVIGTSQLRTPQYPKRVARLVDPEGACVAEGVELNCVNDVSFSSPISRMSNQDLTIPKRLSYSKNLNISNGVPLNDCDSSLTHNKSSICKEASGAAAREITPIPSATLYPYGVQQKAPYPAGVKGSTSFATLVPCKGYRGKGVPPANARINLLRGYPPINSIPLPSIGVGYTSPFGASQLPVHRKPLYPERVKDVGVGHKQKYLKCHTLPLFSTFVYKEWAHRFSFLEYFIWSGRNNDLILPFYAYQNSKSEKRLASICESIRKSSINFLRNKCYLRFSNKSNSFTPSGSTSFATLSGYRGKGVPLVNKNILQEQKRQPHFLQLRNKQGVLRVIKVKKDLSFLFHTKPNFYDIRFANNFVNNGELRRNSLTPYPQLRFTPMGYSRKPLRGLPASLPLYPVKGIGVKEFTIPKELCQRVVLTSCESPLQGMELAGKSALQPVQIEKKSKICKDLLCVNELKNLSCYAFNTIQQDTESTPLNKIDTQQFPRLTELLNFTGGAALRNLLSRFDLIVLSRFLRHELKNLELKVNSLLALKILTYSQGLFLGKLAKRRSKQIRRLKLLELFQSQKSNPEWMILSVIPVLPPDLRPILRVNDDFVVASDLNRLYQTVLRRNNTIYERLDDPLPCPESGLFRQRSLQKAVDGLLENGKGGGTPLCASKRRPLVSLSHVLKGKKGLFRQHLLGKRVDYSGRSVIVVGPRLQVHECGLPKEMAIELFQPFLLHRLKVKGLATSNTTARRMIQQGNPVIWHLLKQLIYEHPVLLNRAPTLHRLGIQAFQPRLVSGRAILLHPLVCNGFNADFDGDQMAVHVPLSFQARAEAWKIMWSKNNFLSPATGQPILVPSQDMVLGCYYLSVSIPRILNANVSSVSHDKAMTDNTNRKFVPCLNVPQMQNKRFDISKLGISRANNFIHNPSVATLVPAATSAPARYKGSKAGIGYKGFRSWGAHSKAFLNENKGQYFSNLQDSLLAYFQGRLQTHTPFWVRIDHKFATEKIIPFASNKSSFNDSSINFSRAIAQVNSITQANCQTNLINNRFCETKAGTTPHLCSTQYPERVKEYSKKPLYPLQGTRVAELVDPFTPAGYGAFCERVAEGRELLLPKVRELLAVNGRERLNDLTEANPNFTNINQDHLKALKLTFLQPLYGSSHEICKTLFQKKSTNNFQIRVEANETLELPLELRLSVDGNLANILTMFQNHYNYNATWVKQCKEESIKYMRTTAGRVVINNVVFKDF